MEVSPQRVIRTVAGLVPFDRRASWSVALQAPHREAAVLGCGAVGLATARLLQRKGFGVTIDTKDTPPDTTSNIAGGYWSPVTLFRRCHGQPSAINTSAALDWQTARPLSPEEHPFPVPNVLRFWAMLIEPPVFLSALQRDFLLNGGKLVIQQFENVDAVAALPQPIIVYCTGLGALHVSPPQRDLVGRNARRGRMVARTVPCHGHPCPRRTPADLRRIQTDIIGTVGANSRTLARSLVRLSTAPSGVYVSILFFIQAVVTLIAALWPYVTR